MAVVLVTGLAAPVHAQTAVGQGASSESQRQAFVDAYNRVGGADAIGQPTGNVHPWGAGCIQDFSGGYLSPAGIMQSDCDGSAHAVTGAHMTYLLDVGGPDEIGYPDNDSHRYGDGWTQDFRGGRRAWTLVMLGDHTGRVHGLFGGIRDHYFALDGVHELGQPASDEYAWNGETRQDFERGTILWNDIDGARRMGSHAIGQGSGTPEAWRRAWRRVGGLDAVGDASSAVHGWGSGCIQDLTGARLAPAGIMQSDCDGSAHAVTGAHMTYLLGVGGPDEIGYPDNDSHRYGDGWTQDFRGGRRGWTLVMLADGAPRAYGVHGGIRDFYLSHSGADGRYGHPVSEEEQVAGYTRQLYQSGAIGWSDATGAFDWDTDHPDATPGPGEDPGAPGDGPIAYGQGADDPAEWAAGVERAGGPGILGEPINTVHEWWGGCTQDLRGGREHRSALMQPNCDGPVHSVSGAFWTFLERRHDGGQGPRWVGYPTGNAELSFYGGGGWRQRFSGGEQGQTEVFVGHRTGVAWGVTGNILEAYRHNVINRIGWPVSRQYQWNGEQRQDFEFGTILFSPESGIRVMVTDTGGPLPAPEDVGCQGLLFVGLRGSGQDEDDFGGLGAQVNAAWTQARDAAQAAGLSAASIAVSYPAHDVVPRVLTPSYFQGQEAGTNNMIRLLESRAEACPNERLVLSGFSQGAMAVEEGLHDLAGDDPHGLLNRVDAVLLIASPRMLASNPYARGTHHPASDGLASQLEELPEGLWDRTVSWCNDNDSVCGGFKLAGHAQYTDDAAMLAQFRAQVAWGLHTRAGHGARPEGGSITPGVFHVSRVSLALTDHTYSAASSWSTSAPITTFEWDHDGDGIYEDSSSRPYLYRHDRGPGQSFMRVTDAVGNQASMQSPPGDNREHGQTVAPRASGAVISADGVLEVSWSTTGFAGEAPSDAVLTDVVEVRLASGGDPWPLATVRTSAGAVRVDVGHLDVADGDRVVVAVPGRSGTAPTTGPDGGDTSQTAVTAGSVGALDRIAGADRVSTALAVSRRIAPAGAADVVIASATGHADALAAVPLATRLNAPLLLVGDHLTDALRDELQRLDVQRVTIVGGEAAVPAAVEADLRALADVSRLAGPTRIATSAAIARALGVEDRVVVVAGFGEGAWADAVGAGALAGQVDAPLLLVGQDLPPETRELLDGVQEVTVVGGSAVVPPSVVADIQRLVPLVERIGGENRWHTSALVAARAVAHGADPRTVVLATPSDFPDALAAGPLAGAGGGVLLLAGGPADAYLPLTTPGTARPAWATVVGGTAALPDRTAVATLQELRSGGGAQPVADPSGPSSIAVGVATTFNDPANSMVDVATGGGSVWILTSGEERTTVTEIDAAGEVRSETAVPDAFVARELVHAGGVVWVTDASGTVWVVDPDSGQVEGLTHPDADGLYDVTVGDGMVYAADEQNGLVLEIDPSSRAMTRAWQLPDPVVALDVSGGWAYAIVTVGPEREERVTALRLDTSEAFSIDPGGDLDHLMDVVIDEDNRVHVSGWEYPAPDDYMAMSRVWSGGLGDRTLTPVDLAEVSCATAIHPDDVALWVVDGCHGELHAYRPGTSTHLETLTLDVDPSAFRGGVDELVPGLGRLWALTGVVDPQLLYGIGEM